MAKVWRNEPPPASASPTWRIRDFAALTVSVLAVAISAFSFYFMQLRVADDLRVTVAGSEMLRESHDRATTPDVGVHLLFSNRGNRPAIVVAADVVVLDAEGRDIVVDRGRRGVPLHAAPTSGSWPILVPANDIRLLTIKVPLEALQAVTPRGGLTAVSRRDFTMAVSVQSIDSSGESHFVISEPFGIWHDWGEFFVTESDKDTHPAASRPVRVYK